MKWLESPTKPGQLYYVPEPIHAYIDYHPLGFYSENMWCLSSRVLGLNSAPLHTKEAEQAKEIASKMVLEKAIELRKNLDNFIKELEINNVREI